MSQKRRPIRPKRPLVSIPRAFRRRHSTAAPTRRVWGWLLLLPIAFFLGRISVPGAPPPPSVVPPASEEEETPVLAATSTAACCPCPEPKKPGPPRPPPIASKKVPPQATADPSGDPTRATAEYVRNSAERFGECAPKVGAGLRVHLEITVAPSGTIERARIANLDPLPEDVSGCVKGVLDTLSPPGFEGAGPETFALTVVL